jgi:2-methylcitrate dehydratase PrpD
MTIIDDLAHRIVAGPVFSGSTSASHSIVFHTLDTVGAWIAGRATGEGQHLARLRSGSPKSPVLFGSSLLDMIALQTATARLTELDDIHMASCTTPGSVVIMTALALAGAGYGSCDGTDFYADAIHTGYEVMTRLGEAVSGPEILHEGVWPTYLLLRRSPLRRSPRSSSILTRTAPRTRWRWR